jgi:hypothetical protein
LLLDDDTPDGAGVIVDWDGDWTVEAAGWVVWGAVLLPVEAGISLCSYLPPPQAAIKIENASRQSDRLIMSLDYTG